MSDQMIECPKCGVFNDVTRRELCWKCGGKLAPLPLEAEGKKS